MIAMCSGLDARWKGTVCCRVWALMCLLVAVGSSGLTAQGESRRNSTSFEATDATSSTPLVQSTDLSYEGAFRLPAAINDENTFEYGGTALAYNPAHNSLLLVGHDWYQRGAEVTIPTVTKSSTLSGLARASFRQPFTDVLEGRIDRIGDGNQKIGGFLVSGDALITSAYLYYDGNGDQVLSHFRSGVDLSRTGDVRGPYQVASPRAGFVSGYMTPIPAEWQAALGGSALTGQCCLSIISRTSFGPAVSVFNPADVGSKNPVPSTAVLGYPEGHTTLGEWDTQNPYFNGTTEIKGVVFPAGTRSVLFFGRHGLGPFCYGTGGATGGDCVDPSGSSKGSHAYPYAFQIWAYDVLDLLAVKYGQKQPWDVRPYQTWTFELPFAHLTRQLGGAAYDPATKRLYLSASYGDGSQPLIHVFSLFTAPTAYGPFGTIDTPAAGAGGMTGSIPVTGWALDDREVSRVRIFRDPVSPETPGTPVFVGNATLIAGARPDVASAYPTFPYSDRAGWGYLLLTNMLPNRGNGTYTLRIIAEDADGHATLLGSRTFTCTNAAAVKPFGAIDTPSQGEVVSGKAFNIFGWALTPLPKMIPTDGSTITVYVDGAPVGQPRYNLYRSDIAGMFPGLNNSSGAVGLLNIDTTAFPDGIHTIAWAVTDSDGRTEGVGSRYFGIQNGAALSTGGVVSGASPRVVTDPNVNRVAPESGTMPLSYEQVSAWRGYRADGPPELLIADGAGSRRVAIKELQRLVLRFSDGSASGDTLEGRVQIGDRSEALPTGSYLDAKAGVFYWQPGIGFKGRHNLVFVRTTANGLRTRIPISVVLEP